MQALVGLFYLFVEKLKSIEWLGPLALRLYLAPIFIGVGAHKFAHFEDMVAWFGNPDWGLGLPAPTLMVFLAASTELLGGFALLLGLATRLAVIPLIMTMVVAAGTAHWDNGWFAIAPGDPETRTPLCWPRWVFPPPRAVCKIASKWVVASVRQKAFCASMAITAG